VEHRILYGAVGRWAGRDGQFPDEVDEHRRQDLQSALFRKRFFFCAERVIKGLDERLVIGRDWILTERGEK